MLQEKSDTPCTHITRARAWETHDDDDVFSFSSLSSCLHTSQAALKEPKEQHTRCTLRFEYSRTTEFLSHIPWLNNPPISWLTFIIYTSRRAAAHAREGVNLFLSPLSLVCSLAASDLEILCGIYTFAFRVLANGSARRWCRRSRPLLPLC